MKRLFALSALCASAFAQTTALLPWQPTQFADNSGKILSGGKVCTYAAGTSTGLATYTDSTGATPNSVPPNAIVLDSSGRANIWLSQDRAYKITVLTAGTDNTCSTGTTIRTVDQIAAGMAARYIGTAAPVSGTYQTGDFVWNSAPTNTVGSASSVLGWVCTAGGTPGTWQAVAPLRAAAQPSATFTWSCAGAVTANATLVLQSGGASACTDTNIYDSTQVVASPGTVAALYVLSGTSSPHANVVVTVGKAGVLQSMTCTLAASGSGMCNDTAHTFSVVAGDLLQIQYVTLAGETLTSLHASVQVNY